jgi:polyhydroxyalkanoate synthesis regulator phasin
MGTGEGPTPPGNGALRPEDGLAALAGLDLALDELAAGDVAASPIDGEAAVLAAVAAELRVAVPPPPPGAAERGRAAFLARAAELQGEPATAELDGAPAAGGPQEDPATTRRPRKAPPSPVVGRRRRLPVRVLALAAALVVLAAVPAVARQARPGTALWPVRQAGQELRVSLADDPVRRAHLRLDRAEQFLAEGARAGEERREDMADKAEDVIDEVLDQLKDVSGSRAAVERARAEELLLAVRALEHRDDPGSGSGSSGSGSGSSGSGSGEDRSGRGGSGSGSSDDDRSGPGGGDGGDDDGGSGSGTSGSSGSKAPGSGSSGSAGSNRSGSGDD